MGKQTNKKIKNRVTHWFEAYDIALTIRIHLNAPKITQLNILHIMKCLKQTK